MNSGFTIVEIEKCITERIFQCFLPYGFSILEKHFAYRTPTPKIPFCLQNTILESSKIIKDNSCITWNVGMDEEKCKNAGRNTYSDLV